MSRAFLSSATVTTIGLACKAFLSLGYCSSLQVNGLRHLATALQSKSRDQGQGVITVSNHISTLDDPLTWGILPSSYYLSSRTTRWTLGASEIVFTNSTFSAFFGLGQTIETFRGQGVYQPAVELAIEKLNEGHWVHLYSEGKIYQPFQWPKDQLIPSIPRLPRFKWGVGRMLMDAQIPPVVIPMWLTGFDSLMPAGRPFPLNYFPKPGADLTVTFGEPIPNELIQQALLAEAPTEATVLDTRIRLTSIVHDAVETLGRSVSPEIFAPRQ